MSYKYESWVMELINLNSIWSCLIVINSNLHVDLWRWMKLGSIVSLRSPIGSYPSFRWTDSKSKSNRLSWKEKIHQKRTLDSVERFEGWNSENKVIIIETEVCFGYVFAHTVFYIWNKRKILMFAELYGALFELVLICLRYLRRLREIYPIDGRGHEIFLKFVHSIFFVEIGHM